MASQITLDAKETAKVKIAIPTSSNKIHYAVQARIYYAYAGTKKWSYTGLQGALAFVLNTSSNTLHFRMVDLDGTGGVIWDHELYEGLVLDQEKTVTFFLSFEGDVGGDKCTIGFVFMDDSEAKTFYNCVKKNKEIKSSKPKRSSWMRSISRGGNNIDKSMISRPKEGGFVHVAHMAYDADSGFTTKGVDPSWTALLGNLEGQLGKEVVADNMDFIKDFIRTYSERQQNQPLAANKPQPPPPLPPRTRSQNGAPTPPPSRPAARTQPLPAAPHRPISPVIEDEQLPPPPPPRRPTPTHGPPPPLERPLPPQPAGLPLPRDNEAKPTTKGVHHSRPRYSESPPSPVGLSHSISRNRSTSPAIVPSRSASYTNNTGTLLRRQESHRSQRVDLPAPNFEAVHEDEAEFLTPDTKQTAQIPSQSSQHDTAPWILASRTPHAPKKPMDDYRESPPSPVVLSHSISRNKSTSPAIVPSRSASYTGNTGTLIRRQESHRSQRVDLPAPTFEAVHEDEAESLTPDTNQTAQLPSQSSQHDTAPWILASRTPHAPKKPMDDLFMAHMADIRRQINESDASSTGSTPPVSLIVPRVSVTSSAFSQSLSVASSPPVAEFPPTPVFEDEIPEGIMRMVKSLPLSSTTSRRFPNRS